MVCIVTDDVRDVSIVHSGDIIPNAIHTNAYCASDLSECGVNVLPCTNDNFNCSVDGLGEPTKSAETNIQDKSSSLSIHCKQLAATEIKDKEGECQKYQSDDDNNDMGNAELPTTKGAYVCGSIQGVCCPMSIDTAATYTVVSARVY